jgi:hypothetical protein
MRKLLCSALVFVALAGCAGGYTLVNQAAPIVVAKAMTVTPSVAWNHAPRRTDQFAYEEVWTADGVLLNQVTFYGGVPEGKKLIRQQKRDEQQVPVFRATMLPQELAEFVEGNYRVLSGSTAFTVEAVAPASFAGSDGFTMDFKYVLQSDEIKRRARATGAIKNGKLYMMIYEGTETHYFPAYLSEFEKLVRSVQINVAG